MTKWDEIAMARKEEEDDCKEFIGKHDPWLWCVILIMASFFVAAMFATLAGK
jgi:hypothetical protein